ncbi:hypothetical protein N752_25685 [Desulforamulus aquiferis]|nr:hypothetical protein [Desulforamulus aquiferis]RYD02347.1 hypothetical protein N752_25685 [Desulforamulus aquiferis]
MAVADIFAALTEERPYRGIMEKNAVLSILYKQIKGGAIDPELTHLLIDNYDLALEARNQITG